MQRYVVSAAHCSSIVSSSAGSRAFMVAISASSALAKVVLPLLGRVGDQCVLVLAYGSHKEGRLSGGHSPVGDLTRQLDSL